MLEVTSPCWRSYPDARGHVTMPEVTSQHCRSLRFHSVLKHVQVNTFIWAENGGSFLFLLFYSKAHPVFSSDVNPVHFTFTREKREKTVDFLWHICFSDHLPFCPCVTYV